MSNNTEYFVSPRQPGVRPVDPPDYDGISFVYVFTRILDPWVVPLPFANTTVVVANAQGFVPGMTIAVETAGYYQVVATEALDRMTIQNLNYPGNAAPGTGLGPANVTTTSLPGPAGQTGPQGPMGEGIEIIGTVSTHANLPATGNNIGDVWVTTDTGHGWAWTAPGQWVDIGPIQGPPGQTGPAGTPGQPGAAGPPGATGSPGIPAYTLSSAGFTVPPIGQTVVANVQDTSWVALNEVLWVQDAAGVGVAGPMQVTAKTATTLTLLNIATSTGGGGGTAAAEVFGETPTGVIDGTNTSYGTAYGYKPNLLAVFLNGLRQRRTSDYTETGSQSFSFLSAPLPGDSLSIDYVQA